MEGTGVSPPTRSHCFAMLPGSSTPRPRRRRRRPVGSPRGLHGGRGSPARWPGRRSADRAAGSSSPGRCRAVRRWRRAWPRRTRATSPVSAGSGSSTPIAEICTNREIPAARHPRSTSATPRGRRRACVRCCRPVRRPRRRPPRRSRRRRPRKRRHPRARCPAAAPRRRVTRAPRGTPRVARARPGRVPTGAGRSADDGPPGRGHRRRRYGTCHHRTRVRRDGRERG